LFLASDRELAGKSLLRLRRLLRAERKPYKRVRRPSCVEGNGRQMRVFIPQWQLPDAARRRRGNRIGDDRARAGRRCGRGQPRTEKAPPPEADGTILVLRARGGVGHGHGVGRIRAVGESGSLPPASAVAATTSRTRRFMVPPLATQTT